MKIAIPALVRCSKILLDKVIHSFRKFNMSVTALVRHEVLERGGMLNLTIYFIVEPVAASSR